MKCVDTHKSYRGDQQNHYPLSDLRDGVVQDAYEYQRNKAYASRISSRKNDYCDDKAFSGSMTDPIKIETNNELRPGNHVVNKYVAALDKSLSTSNDVMVNHTMSTTNEDDPNIIPKRKSHQTISCVMKFSDAAQLCNYVTTDDVLSIADHVKFKFPDELPFNTILSQKLGSSSTLFLQIRMIQHMLII